MKKILLGLTMLAVSASANAQNITVSTGSNAAATQKAVGKTFLQQHITNAANKGAGLSSAFDLLTDSMYGGVPRSYALDRAAPIDSGDFYGTNIINDKSFAYLYDLTADQSGNNDTSVQIVGFISRWTGRIQPASTKMVSFNVWSRGVDKTLRAGHIKYYIYGKPATSLTSKTVKDTTLKTDGNFTVTSLTTPLSNQNTSVYVGVTIPYTWTTLAADTFGLLSTNTGSPATEPNYYSIVAGDTLLDANVMIQGSTGTWQSPNYERGAGVGDPVIAPIVKLSCPNCVPTSVTGVHANNLTFFGNFPNPASNSTSVRFSVAKATSVTLSLMDNTGRLIRTIPAGQMSSGEHTVAIDLSQLATGVYIYMIETAGGDRIASQLTIAK